MALSEISPVTNSAPGLEVLNQPVAVSPSSTQPAAAVSKSALAASSPTTAAASIVSAPKTTVARRGAERGRGTSSSAEQLITETYTATVGGKSYYGSVQKEPDGQYVASVANFPGATADGSSILAAENALGAIIDALA